MPTGKQEYWLQRAQHGDITAWVRVLADQRSRLRRMIELRLDRRMLGRVDPSDVVQIVMVIERKEYEQALAEATHLSLLRPEVPHAWAYRAFALDKSGRPQEALEHIERAIEMCHDYGWRDTRAMILWHLGRYIEAVAECNQLLGKEKLVEPQDLPRYLLVQIFCNGPPELRDIGRANHLAHEIKNVHDRAVAVGIVLMARGEWQQARDQLQALLDEGNSDAGVLVALARTYCELNDLENAKQLYERAVTAARTEPPVWHIEHAQWLDSVVRRLGTDSGQSSHPSTNPLTN